MKREREEGVVRRGVVLLFCRARYNSMRRECVRGVEVGDGQLEIVVEVLTEAGRRGVKRYRGTQVEECIHLLSFFYPLPGSSP